MPKSDGEPFGMWVHVVLALLDLHKWIQQFAYLLAFLMILRIEEAISLQFESIDIIPGEHKYSPLT